MAASTDKFFYAKPLWTGTVGAGGISDAVVTSFGLSSATGLDDGETYVFTVDRVDSNGTETPSKREVIIGVLSTATVTSCLRGQEGTAQAHSAGAVVEILMTAKQWNRVIEGLLVEHGRDGTHDNTKVALLAGTQTFTGTKTFTGIVPIAGTSSSSAGVRLAEDTDNGTNYIGIKSPSAVTTSVDLVLPDGAGSAGQALTTDGSGTLSWASGGTSYWTAVAGTPTRVSDTQFTITDTSNTNKYDLLFKKGVILKWLESTTVNVGMVISSSYGTNTVTVNIVGDSLTSGFTDMKYCMQMAETLDFIIPGTLATGTDLARTHYATTDLIKLNVDAFVKTAGTTNATTFDINDDGSTIITTKPSIASGATSDTNNVCDTPTTVIAEGSAITADIDAVSTTAPIEAYLKLFVFPSSWLYRS